MTICRYCGEIIRRAPSKDYMGEKIGKRGPVEQVWESTAPMVWLVCVDPDTGLRGPFLWHQPFPASLEEMIEMLLSMEEDLR